MKYAVLTGKEQFEIREGEIKTCGGVVIRVTHIGVCGTDVSYWHEGDHYPGVVIGHEYSGIVEDPGNNSALKKGDRVAGYTQNVYNEPCGHCEACLGGNAEGCTNRKVYTWKGGELGHPGAYSERTTWFPHSVCKLPDTVSNEAGAMVEPFAVGLHAVLISEIKPADKVLILGGGIIGVAVAEWCRTYGAEEITMTELNDQKIALLGTLGVCDHIVKANALDIEAQLQAISGGGYDIVIDCAGFPGAFQNGLDALKKEKKMRVTGVALTHVPFPVDYQNMVLREVVFKGSKGHNFDEFRTVVNAIASGRIDVEKYITRRIKLTEVQEGFEQMKREGPVDLKVLIETV